MGTKLVRRKRLILLAALISYAACKRSAPPARAAAPSIPQMTATVVTIQTTTQPDHKTFQHTIAIAGNLARSSDEVDQWRLYDLQANRVTFVDDLAKTRRTEAVTDLVQQRLKGDADPLPDGTPRAAFSTSAAVRSIAGVQATQSTIRSGAYLRELWIGRHPAIPPQLFMMMVASDPPQPELAPMMRSVEAALFELQGFPFAEHAELPYLDRKLAVDRSVLRVETKNVPKAFLTIPADYRELPAIYAPPTRSTPQK